MKRLIIHNPFAYHPVKTVLLIIEYRYTMPGRGGELVDFRWVFIPLLVVLLNVPFGCWRAHVKKFSFQWFLSVHLPVPFVIFLRIYGKLGWHWTTYPLLVGAYLLGQLIGSKIYTRNIFT